MEPDTLQNILTLNFICVWLIELLKRSKYLPWITAETKLVNKAASAILAALSSAGITFAVSHGAGSYTIQIAGLTMATGAHFLWHVMGNYAIQKWMYKVVVPRDNSSRRMGVGAAGRPGKRIMEPEAA